MIIETHNDVVYLSGSLCTNQWTAILATAYLTYTYHPIGIVIDCSGLSCVTQAGALTFDDALEHIERDRYPFVLAHVPKYVKQILRTMNSEKFDIAMAKQMETRRICQATWSTKWWEQLWGADNG